MDKERQVAIAISRLERRGHEATIEAVMQYIAARPQQFTVGALEVPELWRRVRGDCRFFHRIDSLIQEE